MSKRILVLVLLFSVLGAAMVSAQDDACLAQGGHIDDSGQCVLSLSLSIDINYPLELAENEIVANTINPDIAAVRDQFLDYASSGFNPSAAPYQLLATYETSAYSDDIVSLVYTVYEFTGGAHGNTAFKTYTFDLADGTMITLDDLFAEGSDPFAVIAPIAEAQLTETLGDMADPEWIATGTGDTPENYQNFSLSPDGITFYFPPYQVAPYAAGTQTVTIPFSDLTGVLAPEFAG